MGEVQAASRLLVLQVCGKMIDKACLLSGLWSERLGECSTYLPRYLSTQKAAQHAHVDRWFGEEGL